MGTFMSPAFYLSMSGSLISCIVMIGVYRPLGNISIVGVSVIGALTHNLAQLAVAYFILIRHGGIYFLLPLLFGYPWSTSFYALVLFCLLWVRKLQDLPHERRVWAQSGWEGIVSSDWYDETSGMQPGTPPAVDTNGKGKA